MRTAKDLRDDIQAKHDRIDAILAIAQEETRELSTEEQGEIDRIQGAGDKPGEIGELNAQLQRMEKIEARQKTIVAQRAAQVIDTSRMGDDGGLDTRSRIIIPATAKRHGNLKAFKGPDADKDAYCAGKWLQAQFSRDEQIRNDARAWCHDYNIDIRSAAQVEKDNTLGGFFTPTQMETGIIRLVEEYGVYRRNVMPETMTSDKKTTNKRLTGVTIYYPGETETITTSNMTWGQVELSAIKMAGATLVSVELNEDSLISVADQLTTEFAYALAVAEDTNGFLGDGTSTYGQVVGLKNRLASGAKFTALGGNLFSEFLLTDFQSTMAKLSRLPGIRPKWYVHSAVWSAAMDRLAQAAGGNTVTNVVDGTPQTSFLGYPVEFAQVLPSTDVNSQIACYFGDLSMSSKMGVRRGITIAADSSLYFLSDQIVIKVTQRIAINNHETSGTMAALVSASS